MILFLFWWPKIGLRTSREKFRTFRENFSKGPFFSLFSLLLYILIYICFAGFSLPFFMVETVSWLVILATKLCVFSILTKKNESQVVPT